MFGTSTHRGRRPAWLRGGRAATLGLLLSLSATDCTPGRSSPVFVANARGLRDSVTVFVRPSAYPSAAMAQRRQGEVVVAVRSAERPATALPTAMVVLLNREGDTLRARAVDATGSLRLDSVPVGVHIVRAAYIGHHAFAVEVPVHAGCRTDVELYLETAVMGIGPFPPQMPPRGIITTCTPR